MLYVFDTSALIHDPSIIDTCYPNSNIVIPVVVVRELDGLKNLSEHPGTAVRDVLRRLDNARENSSTNTSTDLPQGGEYGIFPRKCGGSITIAKKPHPLFLEDDGSSNDSEIISVAQSLHELNKKDNSNDEVCLITQDRAMSIIAASRGISTSRHISEADKFHLGSGVEHYSPVYDEIAVLYEDGIVEPDGAFDHPVNTGVVLSTPGKGSSSALAIYNGLDFVGLENPDIQLGKVCPRGARQKIAAALMLGEHNGDHAGEFVGSLTGRAGSGKTMLAIACGVESIQRGVHDNIRIFRPTMPISKNTDLGFLPGDIEEKMSPWKSAIGDVTDYLGLDDITVKKGMRRKSRHEDEDALDSILSRISVEPINFVRGRGFYNSFVIIDEAQNCEKHVLKTILSRLGEGSCAVLTWDATQVDNPYLRGQAEGPLSILKDLMPNDMVFHVELRGSERGGVSAIIN